MASESHAAIAGGITSFFDMHNVKPPTVTLERLEEKFQYAAGKCTGNYAFYLDATNDDIDELRQLKSGDTYGMKIFLGTSTDGTQLYVLHLTTEKELALFQAEKIDNKQIIVEVCAHHLFFSEKDCSQRGGFIKCNLTVKKEQDRDAPVKAVAEKSGGYFKTAAGLPLVQYALVGLLELVHDNKVTIERLVETTNHSVVKLFGILDRGYIRAGYWTRHCLA